jgi:hypothetical protein
MGDNNAAQQQQQLIDNNTKISQSQHKGVHDHLLNALVSHTKEHATTIIIPILDHKDDKVVNVTLKEFVDACKPGNPFLAAVHYGDTWFHETVKSLLEPVIFGSSKDDAGVRSVLNGYLGCADDAARAAWKANANNYVYAQESYKDKFLTLIKKLAAAALAYNMGATSLDYVWDSVVTIPANVYNQIYNMALGAANVFQTIPRTEFIETYKITNWHKVRDIVFSAVYKTTTATNQSQSYSAPANALQQFDPALVARVVAIVQRQLGRRERGESFQQGGRDNANSYSRKHQVQSQVPQQRKFQQQYQANPQHQTNPQHQANPQQNQQRRPQNAVMPEPAHGWPIITTAAQDAAFHNKMKGMWADAQKGVLCEACVYNNCKNIHSHQTAACIVHHPNYPFTRKR